LALTVSHLVEQLYGILFDSNDVEAGENVNPYLSACPANENCKPHSSLKKVSLPKFEGLCTYRYIWVTLIEQSHKSPKKHLTNYQCRDFLENVCNNVIISCFNTFYWSSLIVCMRWAESSKMFNNSWNNYAWSWNWLSCSTI